jgi:hypothetical protein
MAAWLRKAGLAVVLTAAAVLSFAALRDLAIAVAIDERLAFLLPIAVDAGAAVSCTVWLAPSVRADARRFACWLTWSLLSATVIGNAAQLGMHANHVVPPWWVAVLVGAVPPAVVGGVVHLLVLDGRAEKHEPVEDEKPTPEVVVPDLSQVDDNGLSKFWQTAPQISPAPTAAARPKPARLRNKGRAIDAVDHDEARRLIQDEGFGAPRLMKALDCKRHVAADLIKLYRPVNGSKVTTS